MKQKLSSSKAFTILEILITIAIISIISYLAFANLTGFSIERKLENETKSLKIMLRSAQEKSLNQEGSYRYGVSVENKTGSQKDNYTLFSVDEVLFASSTYMGVPGTSTQSKSLNSALEISNPSEGNRSNIVFKKVNGQAIENQEISIRAKSSSAITKTIFVYTNGRIEEQ